MDPSEADSALILSKCEDLAAQLVVRLARIDHRTFPSPATSAAADILSTLLQRLQETIPTYKSNFAVLYTQLARTAKLVSEIEESAASWIPLPLVANCDSSWKNLFRSVEESVRPRVFYTVTEHHNFSLEDFNAELGHLFEPLLTAEEIDKSFLGGKIWHLKLPKFEGSNIPLFANVSHEYGHAVFKANERMVQELIDETFGSFLTGLEKELARELEGTAIHKFISDTLKDFCGELFDDAIATFLVGPAFLVALSEMEWGADADAWHVSLQSREQTHPSVAFRVDVITRESGVVTFQTELNTTLKAIVPDVNDSIGSVLSALPGHEQNKVQFVVSPSRHVRRADVSRVLTKHRVVIQHGCRAFAKLCYQKIPKVIVDLDKPSKGGDVAQLVRRIRLGLPPNIFPTGHYLGKPAGLGAILTASALYRRALLSRNLKAPEGEPLVPLPEALARVDRLTLKALEVSYVQSRFYKAFPEHSTHVST